MDTITHALLPVIIYEMSRRESSEWAGKRGVIAIGVGGALPDLINPHLSLAARMSSWSHGLPFWLVLTAALLIAAYFSGRKFSLLLALACSAACLLHIFCDAISGGVNFLYPFGAFVWGKYWVHPVLWIPLDVACLLICYYLFRLRPLLKARKVSALE
ncbi:MAG: metal-dependent hydrolase [Luteolibacter sp.]